MPIGYVSKTSKRSRKIRISVSGGRVIVTSPPRFDKGRLDTIVERHRAWIERAIRKHEKYIDGVRLENESFDKGEFVSKVKDIVASAHKKIAAPYGVKLGKVGVKKMRSRWGSCSGRGNVSINLLLGHLPTRLLDYVVIHEICHLVHHDHSKRFWELVAINDPAFKEHKRELKRYGHFLHLDDMPRDADKDMVK